jgi:DnaJ-class molecular chaperone
MVDGTKEKYKMPEGTQTGTRFVIKNKGFKIGDTLFEENIKNLTEFYKDKKLRRKFLKYLLKYHFKNDAFMFEGMVKSGISDVIPFKKHGIIQIKTFEEAYQAAINFADYVS